MEFEEFLNQLKSQKKTYRKPEKEGIITKRSQTARANQKLAVEANIKRFNKNNKTEEPEQPEQPIQQAIPPDYKYMMDYIQAKQQKKQRKEQINTLAQAVREKLKQDEPKQEEEQLYSYTKYNAYIRELNK